MGEPFYSGKPPPSRWLQVLALLLVLALVGVGWFAYRRVRSVNEDGAFPTPAITPLGSPSGTTARAESSIYDHAFSPTACPYRPVSVAHSADRAKLYGNLAVIAGADADLRELSYTEPVETRNLTTAQFKAKLKRSTIPRNEKTREFQRVYGEVLELLRVIPEADDYQELVTDVTTTQIAGFYDPEKKKVFVPGSVTDPSPLDEFVLSHELEHALADQVLGLPIEDSSAAIESDRQFAARALVEGDAQLTSIFYAINNMSQEELAGIASDPTVAEASDLEIPHVLERGISFPYEEGLNFVCFLYGRGGWKEVNRAYRRPPNSTAEIIFPERYGKVEPPADPADPKAPKGWRLVELSASGALDLLTLFEAPNGEVTAEPSGVVDRVRRWNGGEFGIWSDDKGRAAFTITAIDEPDLGGASPTPHMCVQMQLWFAQNYPEAAELDTGNVAIQGRDLGDAIALLRCTIDKPDIVFAVAPDKRTALALVGVKPVSIAP